MDAIRVKSLTIEAPEEDGYSEHGFDLNIAMPNLIQLDLEDVSINNLVLNDNLTPKLEEIKIQNVGQRFRLNIEASGLKKIELDHVSQGDVNVAYINRMLASAKELEFSTHINFGLIVVPFNLLPTT